MPLFHFYCKYIKSLFSIRDWTSMPTETPNVTFDVTLEDDIFGLKPFLLMSPSAFYGTITSKQLYL